MSQETKTEEKPIGEPKKSENAEVAEPAIEKVEKPERKPMDPDVRDNRLLASLSYVGLLFLVPLLARNRSEFALFHCRQGIVVFAVQSILSLVTWIPNFGSIIYILVLAISVVGIVMAWRGERWEIPLLGKYAQMLRV
ncbi:hypothetical protein JW899_02350 [Candidatus Uhrbacteria bacterium]|nr:hypothetical protein [Candidatus Uhrbacteria bacterium]